MDPTATDPTRRTTPALLGMALGAATSAGVVTAALAGHQFGLADLGAVLAVAAVILGLNLQPVPQRQLLRTLPSQWNDPVVIRAAKAVHPAGQATPRTGHAA